MDPRIRLVFWEEGFKTSYKLVNIGLAGPGLHNTKCKLGSMTTEHIFLHPTFFWKLEHPGLCIGWWMQPSLLETFNPYKNEINKADNNGKANQKALQFTCYNSCSRNPIARPPSIFVQQNTSNHLQVAALVVVFTCYNSCSRNPIARPPSIFVQQNTSNHLQVAALVVVRTTYGSSM
jgi:hypothetical protein